MRISRAHIRIALRSHARRPTFATAAVLSLALAIALNTTMYSVLDALLNPKMDIVAPQDVYALSYAGDLRHRVDNTQRTALLRSGFRTYEALSYYEQNRGPVAVEVGRRYSQATSMTVAPNLAHLLGMQPIAGRLFIDADFAAGTQPVMITDRLAATLFPAGEQPIGAIVDVDGEPHPIVGVMRSSGHFPAGDVWVLPSTRVALASLPVNLVRIRRGVPIRDAQAELDVLARRMESLSGDAGRSAAFVLRPVIQTQFHYQHFHFALIAAVVAVLLIACANLANLQLARGLGRARELAIRASLGATRRDIVTQLLVESAVLAVGGLVFGILATWWAVGLLRSRIPPSIGDFIVAPQMSWRVLAFSIIACIGCIALVGLMPAIRVSRVDPNEVMKSAAGTGANRANRRRYGAMIVAQLGLSLAVLSGAAVVVRSMLRLRDFNMGFDARQMSQALMFLGIDHDTTLSLIVVMNETVNRVKALPNVASASVEIYRSAVNNTATVYDAGNAIQEVPTPLFGYTIVSTSELSTYQLPVVRGRNFLDGVREEPEVIVDEQTARVLWPHGDPVGQRIKLGDARSDVPWARVIGVVGVRRPAMGLGVDGWLGVEAPPESQTTKRPGRVFYAPAVRDSTRGRFLRLNIAVRSQSDPDRMPIILRRGLLHAPPLRLLGVWPMDESLRRVREGLAFVASMFCLFAFVGLALVALGTYGIVAFSVAERRRELGVRIALGATPGNILGVVLREGNALALAGIAIGLLLTKLTMRWLQAFAFENDLYDAPMFAGVAISLFVVAVVAALVPALRATRIDPVESLRSE